MSFTAVLLAGLTAMSGVWSGWKANNGQWELLAPLLSESGFDTVFFLAAYGPVIDGEGLRECIDACHPQGIEVHAWVVMWRTNFVSDEERARLARESRFQAMDDGGILEDWLNPTDPRNVELMAKTCLELAACYPVDGIQLDYIRFRSYLSGYSRGTGQRFLAENRTRGLIWPDDCLSGGRYYDLFMRWRAERITAAVRAVRDSLGRINRVVPLSAAVLPRRGQMLSFGQEWDRWLREDLVDFVVPMNYTPSDDRLEEWAAHQMELAEGGTLLCGIGFTAGENQLSPGEMRHQTGLAERLGFDGYSVFSLSGRFRSEVLGLGEGSREGR